MLLRRISNARRQRCSSTDSLPSTQPSLSLEDRVGEEEGEGEGEGDREAAPVFRVFLEKKGRGRGALGLLSGRPWATRTFKLRRQSLKYFDRDELRGEIDIRGAKCFKLEYNDKDKDKRFTFEIECVSKERVVLNASCEDIRLRCLEIFSRAARDPMWELPQGMVTVVGEDDEDKDKDAIVKDSKTLWFYEAVNDGSVEEVKDMYDEYRDHIEIDFLSPEDGQTPLTSACYRNNLGIVKCLIEHCHAKVNFPNYHGITALMLAVNFNRKELAEYLINYPACDVDVVDQSGKSAYFLTDDEHLKKLILNRSTRVEDYLKEAQTLPEIEEAHQAVSIDDSNSESLRTRDIENSDRLLSAEVSRISLETKNLTEVLDTQADVISSESTPLSHPLQSFFSDVIVRSKSYEESPKKVVPQRNDDKILSESTEPLSHPLQDFFSDVIVRSKSVDESHPKKVVPHDEQHKIRSESIELLSHPLQTNFNDVIVRSKSHDGSHPTNEHAVPQISDEINSESTDERLSLPLKDVIVHEDTHETVVPQINEEIVAESTERLSLSLPLEDVIVRSNSHEDSHPKDEPVEVVPQISDEMLSESHEESQPTTTTTTQITATSTNHSNTANEVFVVNSTSTPAAAATTTIQGIPSHLYAAFIKYSISNNELQLSDAMKSRNLARAKQHSQLRDDFKKQLLELGDVPLSQEYTKLDKPADQKVWLECELNKYIDTLWNDDTISEQQKLEAIEQATLFLEQRLVEHTETNMVAAPPISADSLVVNTTVSLSSTNTSLFLLDALFITRNGETNNVSVRLATVEVLNNLQNEHDIMVALYSQSTRVVIKPISLLSSVTVTMDGTSFQKGLIRSTVSEDQTAALGSCGALILSKHGDNLLNYVHHPSIRYGERLMIVEAIVDIVLVAHNCGFCLLHDLTPLNIVKSLQSADFVLGGLSNTTRMLQQVSVSALRLADARFWSFEFAKQQSCDDLFVANGNVDLCALGWIIWLVMGGVSLWDQRGINSRDSEEVISCLCSITDQEIQQAIYTAFPQENKSSLRRLLIDLLQTDPAKRCDLSTIYDSYSFFGRSDIDSVDERAILEKQLSQRLAQEEEAARKATQYVQRSDALKRNLVAMVEAFESQPSNWLDILETIKGSSDVSPMLLNSLPLIMKNSSNNHHRGTEFARILDSILQFHVDDMLNLPIISQRVRNELKGRGNCMPHLFCMIPVVNYSAQSRSNNSAGTSNATRLMQQFKHLYWNRSKLVFICPITLRIMQSGRSRQGYQLDPPEQWIMQAAPFLKSGILLLKLALLIHDPALLPKDFQISIEDLDSVVDMLTAISSLEPSTTTTTTTTTIAQPKNEEKIVIQTLFELIGREEGVDVHKLFSTWRLQRTGLIFTTCVQPRKTSSAWISEEGRHIFEEHGEEGFLLH